MAKLTLEIECDNAAFDDHPSDEIARILRGVADDFAGYGRPGRREIRTGSLRDINGNRVGRFEYIGD